MRKFLLFFTAVFITFSCTQDSIKVEIVNLQCHYLTNPVGIDQDPLLSWKFISGKYNVIQKAYRIIVADSKENVDEENGNIWDSEKVNSSQSVCVEYAGNDLIPGKKYFWKIKAWDQNGIESDWSETATWQMALSHKDWEKAKWIGYELFDESNRLVPGIPGYGYKLEKEIKQTPTPLFRKIFTVEKEVESITLSISGLGLYEAWLNGKKLGDSFMSPGWTDYDQRILFNTYDLTDQVQKGENVLGVIVGKGYLNNNKERYRKLIIAYGNPQMIAHLKINYADGSEETIVTDECWKTAPSPITFSNFYGGENYDATLEQNGWDSPGFDDSSWEDALLVKPLNGRMSSEVGHPMKIAETFDAVTINKIDDNNYVYDFGQNLSGIVEIQVQGKKGQQVKIWPCELTRENGSFTQQWTGHPHFYTYTLKGDGLEIWKPRFAYYGYRYAQVEGAVPDTFSSNSNGLPIIKKLTSLHIRNSMPANGTFECSNELFNQIYELINWGIKSNLQSVMTDCPHREKLGWIEQTYLMGESIHYNWDVYHLYKNIIYNMMAGQHDNGMVPNFVPEYVYFGDEFTDSPEWGSASIILPWLLYRWYGDMEIIKESWPMMQRYIKYLVSKSEDYLIIYGLGDWYDIGPDLPGFSQLTPAGITATATFYYDLVLMSKIAALLNKPVERDDYQIMAGKVRLAYNEKFFDKDRAVYGSESQTCLAMPLVVGLVEEQYREGVLSNLVDSINANDKALTAGDIGFHYLVEALVEGGQSELLFEMNNRDNVPGYGYQIKKGATSLTESWEALARKSNNHLMLGHIMEWFFSGIGGIQQTDSSIAYKELIIKPEIVGDITSAKAIFYSPYGEVVSDWKIYNNEFVLAVTVPPNSSALVYMPVKGEVEIKNNKGKICGNYENFRTFKNRNVYKVGSGEYIFSLDFGK